MAERSKLIYHKLFFSFSISNTMRIWRIDWPAIDSGKRNEQKKKKKYESLRKLTFLISIV